MSRDVAQRRIQGKTKRGMSDAAVAAKIKRLNAAPAPVASSTRENLDRPLDPDVDVTGKQPYYEFRLKVNGVVVSWASVLDFQQQIGQQTVRMAGLGGVGTHPKYRFRGHARRLLGNVVRWMRQSGFDTSMLYGIPRFYPKLGYVVAFPSICTYVSRKEAERPRPPRVSWVDFAPQHLKAILGMYRRNNVGRTGPTWRFSRDFRQFRYGSYYNEPARCRVALDGRGGAIGYFVFDEQSPLCTVVEVGFARTNVFASVLSACGKLAKERGVEQIRFILPEDHGFVRFCENFGARKEMAYRSDGAAMVRLINIPSALRRVASDVGARLSERGALNLRTNLDSVGLSWNGGSLRVGALRKHCPTARMPQWALAQLVYGYRDARTLAREGIVRAPEVAIDALTRMFPVTPHFHYPADMF